MIPTRFAPTAALFLFGAPCVFAGERPAPPTPIQVTGSFGGDHAAICSSILAADGTRIPHGLTVVLGPEARLQRTEVFDDGFLTNREVFHDGRLMIRQEFSRTPLGDRVENGYELTWDANSPSETFAEGWRSDGRRWNGTFLVVERDVVDFRPEFRLSRRSYRDGGLVETEPVGFERLGLAPEAAETWVRSLPAEITSAGE